MRVKLTPALVERAPLPLKGDRAIYWDTGGGFGLMVMANGHRSFVVQYRANGRSRRMSLKAGLSLTDARKEARAILGAVAKGGDPLAEKRRQQAIATNSLRSVAEEYFGREGKKLRSINQRRRLLVRLVFPRLGSRPIDEIRRSEIVRLLDRIEDENGPRQAHVVLAYLSKLFNWHASRDDDFRSPIVRGMGRINAQERARSRILDDDELRAVWRATEAPRSVFGTYVRFLLLTATRRGEAAHMRWDELANGDWIIPSERMKAKQEHVVPLSRAAKAILDDMPNAGVYIFTLNGRRPIGGYAWFKAHLDNASGVTAWTLHDLRRTARSLMSRAGVAPDIAERCLAHIPGTTVSRTYDRHAYHDEKAHAFEALAAQIGRIVNPPAANVVPLQKQA